MTTTIELAQQALNADQAWFDGSRNRRQSQILRRASDDAWTAYMNATGITTREAAYLSATRELRNA